MLVLADLLDVYRGAGAAERDAGLLLLQREQLLRCRRRRRAQEAVRGHEGIRRRLRCRRQVAPLRGTVFLSGWLHTTCSMLCPSRGLQMKGRRSAETWVPGQRLFNKY